MQTSHQSRNQQMPVIGAGRDAIQQQHALETALVQMRAELSAELSASWEARLAAVEARHSEHLHARLAAVEAERLGWREAAALCGFPIESQSMANPWPVSPRPYAICGWSPSPMVFHSHRRRRWQCVGPNA
jgi:hypothetical protein